MSAIEAAAVAEQRDLLLEPSEIAELAKEVSGSTSADTNNIYQLCGGWAGAVCILLRDAEAISPATQLIRRGLALWLEPMDFQQELCEVAFLSIIDDDTVEAFYAEISESSSHMEQLLEGGILRRRTPDGLFIPSMIRQLLLERARVLGAERIEILERAASGAIASVFGVEKAANDAARLRKWNSLMMLLMENWVGILLKNPRRLSALIGKLPKFIVRKTGYLQAGIRILTAVADTDGVLLTPATKPDYSTDRVGQMLREKTQLLYRHPNSQAISLGLLEVLHLRAGGLFEESADAARKLRDALHQSLQSNQHLNPSLVGLASLQAGVSLQMVGQTPEASKAYKQAWYSGRQAEQSFLLANSAGKISLLHAMEGDIPLARKYLAEHDRFIDDVEWGNPAAAHTANMARAYIDMADVDYSSLANTLSLLPAPPNSSDFWAVQVHLVAMQKIHAGIPESVRELVSSVRWRRGEAAEASMSKNLLDDALATASIYDQKAGSSELTIATIDPSMSALGHLCAGQHDKALAVLNDGPLHSGFRRGGNLPLYLELAARHTSGPTPSAVDQIRRMHTNSGELYEIVILMSVPGWSSVGNDLGLLPEISKRLKETVTSPSEVLPPRPVLTPREQEILAQLRLGMTRRQIAEDGFRSENTVKTQIRSLYRKFEVADLEQLLAQTRKHGF